MTKKIKRKDINGIINSVATLANFNKKNIFGLRCERFARDMAKIAKELNDQLSTIAEEHASTDKDFNLLKEEILVTDKQGVSRKEPTGEYKYTFKRSQERKKTVEEFLNEELEVKANVVERKEQYMELYKKIINENSFTVISNLAGIILDIPLDKEGFVDEDWILNFLSSDTPKGELNGKSNTPKLEATVTE